MESRITEPGKRIADEFYIHLSAVETIQDETIRQAIRRAVQGLPPQPSHVPNVAKINVVTGRLSLLSYPDFFDSPFPVLAATWVTTEVGPRLQHDLEEHGLPATVRVEGDKVFIHYTPPVFAWFPTMAHW
jgi:hypothetical protein